MSEEQHSPKEPVGEQGSEAQRAAARSGTPSAASRALEMLQAAELVLWREDLAVEVAVPLLRAVSSFYAGLEPAPQTSARDPLHRLRTLLAAGEGSMTPSRADLLATCAQLRRELLTPVAARRRIESLLRIAAVLGILISMAGYLWIRGVPGRGPWRGEYFARDDLSGTPSLRFDDTIDFTWEKEPPHPELPPEKFSVRWEACLVVSRDIPDAALQLISDDGSRLFLDGQLVIDGWAERKGIRTHGTETPLAVGTHTLRVEYFHKSGTPRIALVASLDGGPPSVIPAGMLRRPRSAPGAPEGLSCGG